MGPPWMMTRSGEGDPGFQPAGFRKTPSITAPSELFHDTTSLVPSVIEATWLPRSDIFLALPPVVPANTSGYREAELPRNATLVPLSLKEKPAAMGWPRFTRDTVFAVGSSLNRPASVLRLAARKIPVLFQATS